MEGVKLEEGELRIKYTLAADGLAGDLAHRYEADSAGGILVLLNVQPDDSMRDEGTAREIINRVQKLRKEAKLVPTDAIRVYYRLKGGKEEGGGGDLRRVLVDFREYILAGLKTEFVDLEGGKTKPPAEFLISSESDIKGEVIELAIERLSPSPATTAATSGQGKLFWFNWFFFQG